MVQIAATHNPLAMALANALIKAHLGNPGIYTPHRPVGTPKKAHSGNSAKFRSKSLGIKWRP